MSVLQQIVADKRGDVAERMRVQPLLAFRGQLEPSDRSLEAVLRRPRTGFILECKQASPSQGVLRASYDPEAIARTYAPHADAISVLCDGPYFGGDLAHLSQVRAAVAVPVLCKDFVVHPYQVYEARRHGADAILLMASVLSSAELAACLSAAAELAMDALVEVHDAGELEAVLDTEARIIGINNRNLKTLEVDLETTRRLAPRVPADRVVVGESGIRDHADVRGLRPLCDAFLVGTAMMRRLDLSAAVRELVYGRAKVCGLTAVDDAEAAVRAGATHGGLVLWPGSKRAMGIDGARALVGADLRWVGVFVNAPATEVITAAGELGLWGVQLHGDEPPEVARSIKAERPDLEVWRALRVGKEPLRSARDHGADRLLLDAFVEGERGGTGHRFDWRRAEEHPERSTLVLSGGITPERAQGADAVGAWALDASSGLEASPGRKDPAKLERFFAALRGSSRRES